MEQEEEFNVKGDIMYKIVIHKEENVKEVETGDWAVLKTVQAKTEDLKKLILEIDNNNTSTYSRENPEANTIDIKGYTPEREVTKKVNKQVLDIVVDGDDMLVKRILDAIFDKS